MCGYVHVTVPAALIQKNFDLSKVIHEMGCVQAGEQWMERNLISISTCAIFLAFFQVS